MISVRDISKSFGPIRAVRGVSFELVPNQVAGLLGPNGAGKSTTIRMITGFLAPDKGSISLAGHCVRTDPAVAKSHIGYLPEHAPIYPEMSVKGYLKHRARLLGVEAKECAKAADRAIEMCQLRGMDRRRVGTLSKGYKQRVGLAGALVHDPPILVLDEPTNGLDPTQIREARALIRELAQRKTMLICSHILPEIERICDRVMIMNQGSIRADAPPNELVERTPGPARYIVEARTNPTAGIEHCLRTLGSLPGVIGSAACEDQPTDSARGWCRIELVADPSEPDLREPIAGAAEDHGLFVRELTRVRPTLESYFMRLIESPADSRTETHNQTGRDR